MRVGDPLSHEVRDAEVDCQKSVQYLPAAEPRAVQRKINTLKAEWDQDKRLNGDEHRR